MEPASYNSLTGSQYLMNKVLTGPYVHVIQALAHTHTHTHKTVLWLYGFCPGQPG